MRVDLQPAYILHTRAYRDTSLLVDVFSENYGKLSLIAKGARKPKQYQRYLLQPFIPLFISWQGKSSLKTLTAIEASTQPVELHSRFLYSGLYLNELLNYVLPSNDPSPEVFQLYATALEQLAHQVDLESCLRQFEFSLLVELGYGIDFTVDASSGKPIQATGIYHFIVEHGFVEVIKNTATVSCFDDKPSFAGELLIAIAHDQFGQQDVRRAAKQIARLALEPYLRGKVLKSRDLFRC